MANARKRGDSWRCLAYIGTVDGKRKYKSFTAKTKQEAERAAAMYETKLSEEMTVLEAITDYIDSKRAVLSPSTITGYRSYTRRAYGPIADIQLNSLKNSSVQKWVSWLVDEGKSPKYIRNVYNLLHSTMALYRPQKPISATLPARPRKHSYVPTNDEIREILPLFDDEMQRAIMLAAYCSLRCGEVCALTDKDLNGNVLTIDKAMSLMPSGEYATRQPKTADSIRKVTVPNFVLEKLEGIEGKFVKRTPVMVSGKFKKTMSKNGYAFRFHDLRHFFASELAKTMPLAVIERMGGWSPGSPVLRQIYIGAQEAELAQNMAAASAVFDNMQPSMQP